MEKPEGQFPGTGLRDMGPGIPPPRSSTKAACAAKHGATSSTSEMRTLSWKNRKSSKCLSGVYVAGSVWSGGHEGGYPLLSRNLEGTQWCIDKSVAVQQGALQTALGESCNSRLCL